MITINLSQRAFIQRAMSGDVYCAAYASEDSDQIIAISDVLHHSEFRAEDGSLLSPENIELSTEDVDWANSQRWTILS